MNTDIPTLFDTFEQRRRREPVALTTSAPRASATYSKVSVVISADGFAGVRRGKTCSNEGV